MSPISTQRWNRACPHLDRLLEMAPDECSGYIAALRGDDPALAADLEALLDEHQLLTAEGFLASPASVTPPEITLAGVTIGPYTLVSPIGYGGMGSVWLAERSDGRFVGRVAVKLLNAALLGRSAEKRFEREGTILARLTHRNIGRLVDAGVSDTGQPYLVLEYIEGRPIDRYCDDKGLDIDERVRLFLDVQAAVAHAHASLIVHRDLKPSNVLVTSDGTVKLLDFGIAKLLETESGPAASLLTRDGDVALTPKYAAPEQVRGGAITTATDVYALGVILFELLTGVHPTGGDAQRAAEFARAITDREPLRLSAAMRVRTGEDAALTRATARGTTPDRLRRALKGDLEVILAKALKPDPAERYASVQAFADDLRRYLEHLPIAACGDALVYRAAKFVRRHHRVLAAVAIVVLVVAALTVFYTTRLSAERDRARQEAARSAKVSELLIALLMNADPYRSPDTDDARNPLDLASQRIVSELPGDPDLQARLLTIVGRTYERMGKHERALPLLQRALAIGRARAGARTAVLGQTLNDLGVLYREQGDDAHAEPLLREALDVRRQVLGNGHADVAVTLVELARVLNDTGRAEAAEPLLRESLAIRRSVYGDEHQETAVSKAELGRLLMQRGDLPGAEPFLRENVATTTHTLGPDHPNTAAAKSALAQLLLTRGDVTGGEALLREAADINRRVFGSRRTRIRAVTEQPRRRRGVERPSRRCAATPGALSADRRAAARSGASARADVRPESRARAHRTRRGRGDRIVTP